MSEQAQPVESTVTQSVELPKYPSKLAELKKFHAKLREFLALIPNTWNFTHIRAACDDDSMNQFGGATVCWKMPAHKHDCMLSVSIAWCNPNEPFSKLLGRYHAAQQYSNGLRMYIRISPYDGISTISDRIRDVFYNGFFSRPEYTPVGSSSDGEQDAISPEDVV